MLQIDRKLSLKCPMKVLNKLSFGQWSASVTHLHKAKEYICIIFDFMGLIRH